MKINHIAIIPDGNRRYGKKMGVSVEQSHQIGAKRMKELLTWIKQADIPTATIYCLSKDNLKRDKKELKDLFTLIEDKLFDLLKNKEDISVNIIGNSNHWTKRLIDIASGYNNNPNSKYNLNLLIAPDKVEINNLDLLIRTGGMHRLSGFPINAYTTIYFSNSLFPEFSKGEFDYIINEWYPKQIQNFGR